MITEDDDPLLALRLGLRDGQVLLVVFGSPHVAEVGEVARGDVDRGDGLPVGVPKICFKIMDSVPLINPSSRSFIFLNF